jgi:hypothetical protein
MRQVAVKVPPEELVAVVVFGQPEMTEMSVLTAVLVAVAVSPVQ